ncbi:hypothetical protein D3C87_1516670 [compost metagenome]
MPLRHHVVVHLAGRVVSHDAGQFMQLFARQAHAQARRSDRVQSVGDGIPAIGRGGLDHSGCQLARRSRNAAQLAPYVGQILIAVVSAKKFIAGVSRQTHGDVTACHLRNEIGGYLRRVGKGLAVDVRQFRYDVQSVRAGHIELGMFGAQMEGHSFCVLRLVVAGVVEADGKGLDLLR